MPLAVIHTPAHVLQQGLIAAGQVGDPTAKPLPAWPAFVGKRPSIQGLDNIVIVFNTTPQYDGRIHNDGQAHYHYGIMLKVVGSTDPVTHNKAELLHRYMSEVLYGLQVTIAATPDVGAAVYRINSLSKFQRNFLGQDTPRTKLTADTINCLAAIVRLS